MIARELGFASWPRLKVSVDDRASTPEGLAEALVAASVERRRLEAAAILAAHPNIASSSIYAAAILGDARAVSKFLTADPSAAIAIDQDRGWPPLLYACYSQWHQIDPSRTLGMAAAVHLLLNAGANPNTNNGGRRAYRSALKGSVEVNNPDVTRVLLDAGVNPDDGQCIVEAAGHGDHRCLELLLSHGARVVRTWAIGAAVYADDALAVSLLLETVRSSGAQTATLATSGLAEAAAANASADVFAALVAAGADPDTRDSDVGVSALRRAVRAGKVETAALLASHGASDDSTDVDRLIGACWRADQAAAERLLARAP